MLLIKTGNREWGMEVWELVYRGNLPKNSKCQTKEKKRFEEKKQFGLKAKKKRNNLGKCEEVLQL